VRHVRTCSSCFAQTFRLIALVVEKPYACECEVSWRKRHTRKQQPTLQCHATVPTYQAIANQLFVTFMQIAVTDMRTHTHTCTQTDTRTHTYARKHLPTDTHARTHTHTHKVQQLTWPKSWLSPAMQAFLRTKPTISSRSSPDKLLLSVRSMHSRK